MCVRRPHAFKAVYSVTLHGEQLRTDLRVINTGESRFDFTAALHTYIEVLDIKVGADSHARTSLKDVQGMHCSPADACMRPQASRSDDLP
jgi:D-hexose-6-phosphate mutarotase